MIPLFELPKCDAFQTHFETRKELERFMSFLKENGYEDRYPQEDRGDERYIVVYNKEGKEFRTEDSSAKMPEDIVVVPASELYVLPFFKARFSSPRECIDFILKLIEDGFHGNLLTVGDETFIGVDRVKKEYFKIDALYYFDLCEFPEYEISQTVSFTLKKKKETVFIKGKEYYLEDIENLNPLK